MRIGIYCELLKDREPTGIGLHIRNLLAALGPIDCSNEYLLYHQCPVSGPRSLPDDLLPGPNFRWRPVRFPAGWHWDRPRLWWDFYLPRVLRRDRIDVFHGPNHFLPDPGGYRQVVTIHDLAYFHMQVHGPGVDDLARHWTLKALERADRVVALSENTRRDVEALGVAPERIRVIYGGSNVVPEEQIRIDRAEEVRSIFGLPERYILFVGTLQPRKNVPFLLRAFAQLKRRTTLPHGLVLAGQRGQAASEIDGMIAELDIAGDVVITGFVEDWQLPLLYRQADVFVLPTLYEGFTLVTLEAMAYGVPVIATNTSSIREGTGDAAELVPSNNDDLLASSIERVLSDSELRSAMVTRGRQQAQRFTWEICAANTVNLYGDLFENY